MARRFGAAPLVFLAFLAALPLGYEQAVASILSRERAAPGSWPSLVPAWLAAAVDAREPLFATPALELLLARRALDDGRLDLAAQRLARLRESNARTALEGRLAEARGDEAGALRAYLAAGDSDGVQRRALALAAAGHIDEALVLERNLAAGLQSDPTQVDALADTWLAIGRLEQSQAYRAGMTTPEGRAAAERAGDAYGRAVALAPLSERYLISAASQELNLGDLDAAQALFLRARAVDPSAAEAYVGLGEVARRRGLPDEARAQLARAQALAPGLESAQRLARELGP